MTPVAATARNIIRQHWPLRDDPAHRRIIRWVIPIARTGRLPRV